jgi:la-related protein 1
MEENNALVTPVANAQSSEPEKVESAPATAPSTGHTATAKAALAVPTSVIEAPPSTTTTSSKTEAKIEKVAKKMAESAPSEPAQVPRQDVEEWKEVKRRGRDRQSSLSLSFSESSPADSRQSQERTEEKKGRERQPSLSLSKPDAVDQCEDREELDFQFDEELDNPLPAVKQNTFSEWSDSESECDEVGDDFINKVKLTPY